MSSTGNTDLERLLNELADGTLTEDDERHLAEMLRADSSARRDYRRFMALHADLQWDYAAAVVAQPETLPTAPTKQAGTGIRAKWLMAAVVLFLAVSGSFVLFWLPPNGLDAGQAVIGCVVPVAGEVKLTEDGPGPRRYARDGTSFGRRRFRCRIIGTGRAAVGRRHGNQPCRRDTHKLPSTQRPDHSHSPRGQPQCARGPSESRTSTANSYVEC